MSTTTATRPAQGTLPVFLEDWKTNHRELSEESRAKVGRYIEAIVALSVKNGGDTALSGEVTKRMLWRQFREFFDDLTGMFSRSEREDFIKAMKRL